MLFSTLIAAIIILTLFLLGFLYYIEEKLFSKFNLQDNRYVERFISILQGLVIAGAVIGAIFAVTTSAVLA